MRTTICITNACRNGTVTIDTDDTMTPGAVASIEAVSPYGNPIDLDIKHVREMHRVLGFILESQGDEK